MILLMFQLLLQLNIFIYMVNCSSEIKQSPIFVGTFSEQIVERGIRLSLKCSAKGNPLPQITWKLDNLPINEAYHVRIGDYVSDIYTVNSYVNISSTKTDDGGYYSCRASNTAGAIQHTARINVLGPPYIRPMVNLTVLSAQNIQITCPYSGYPIKSVTWLRGGRRLPQNHRQKVFTNGTFMINNVEKAADAAQYQCLVSDEEGRSAKRDLFVNVVVSPVVEPFYFPNDLVSGRRAGAACIVSAGDLPIRIKWLKDGQSIPDELMPMVDTKDFTSFLTFDKVSRAHRGNYTCLAENPASTSNYTTSLIVQVPPSWIVEPKDKSVIKGNSLTLDCQADGSPRPIIRWKKSTDGEDFKVVISNAHIQTLENGSLTIREVTKEDAGHYMCQAMNGIGPGASMVVRVTVSVAAHFEKKFETHSVKLGDDVTIRCVAIGEKDIRITWTRDRKLITPTTEPRYIFEQIEKSDKTESIFKIRATERGDSALFTCHGENNYGKDNSNFQIVVQEPPDCPVDIKTEEIGSRSFALTWTHPFNGNSPITGYLLEYKLANNFYTQLGNGKGIIKEIISPTGINHIVKGLEPQTTYLITLSSQNIFGISTDCLPVSVTTEGEPPSGSPRDVKVVPISSTSLQINWRPPLTTEQNGPILGYYVGYRQQRSSSPDEFSYKTIEAKSVSSSSQSSSSLSISLSPSSPVTPSSPINSDDKYTEETCQINGLRKLTRYLIIVQAYNKKGAGPPSDQIEAQTLEFDPPDAPILKVSSTTLNSVILSWDIIDDSIPQDPMSGYIVYYKVEKGDWEEIPIYADKLRYTVKNLACGKRYQFYIIPFNSAGKGQPSEVISAKTMGTAPIAPDSHDLITVNSTFALINLTSWSSGGCPIQNFNVQYKVKSSREYILVSNNIIPDQRTVYLSDLNPATWYNIFITGYNEAGSTGAEYTFGTLTASGEPIPYPIHDNLEDLAHQLKIVMPLASALVVLTLIMGVICAMFKKRHFPPQHISGGVGGCDGSKSCESMPLSDWDSTIKRSSLRGSTIDEPGMGFFTPSGTTNNNLKLNRCSNTNGNSVPGNDVSVGTNNSGAKVNESIYFPSPYALSRISAYERSLSSSAGNEPRTPHSIIVNGTGSHTYDVPLKKCLINSGNPVHGNVLGQNKSPEHRIIDLTARPGSNPEDKLYERLEFLKDRRLEKEKYDLSCNYASSSVYTQPRRKRKTDDIDEQLEPNQHHHYQQQSAAINDCSLFS